MSALDARRNYHQTIGRLIELAKLEKLSSDQMDEVDRIAESHKWDGFSCSCGGGWMVGHNSGCPDASPAVAEEAVERALHGRVPGGSEVWVWIDQRDPFVPSENARDVVRAALEASGLAEAAS